MATVTTNYGFTKPGVNDPIDANLWGTETNNNWDTLDTDLKSVSDVANAAAAYVDHGDLKPTARSTAPAKWLLCYGQAISRTTYADLFTAIGTTYGSGDGSTTFNVPDIRGRVLAGVDNMGGSAANRITNAVSGITGTTLGAAGGDQNVQQHTHTANVTDPGHTHDANATYGAAANNPSGAAVSQNTSVSPRLVTKSSTTGITVTNDDFGTGSSQNVQPTIMVNWLIFAGV